MLQSTLKQDCCCEWLNVQTFSVWDAGRSLQQVGGTMKRAARNNEQTVHATACANKNGVTRLQLLSWLYEYAGTTYVWPFRTTVSPQLAAKLPRPRGQMLVNKAWRCYLWRVRQSTSFDLLKRNRKGKKSQIIVGCSCSHGNIPLREPQHSLFCCPIASLHGGRATELDSPARK